MYHPVVVDFISADVPVADELGFHFAPKGGFRVVGLCVQ